MFKCKSWCCCYCRRQRALLCNHFVWPYIMYARHIKFSHFFSFLLFCSRRIMNFVAVCFNWFWLNFSSFLWPNLTSVYTVAAPLEVAMVAISVSLPHSATIKVKSLFYLLLCLSRICCYISVSSALSESGNVIRFLPLCWGLDVKIVIVSMEISAVFLGKSANKRNVAGFKQINRTMKQGKLNVKHFITEIDAYMSVRAHHKGKIGENLFGRCCCCCFVLARKHFERNFSRRRKCQEINHE